MALKDLKSILSDFRIPKKTPLADMGTGTINKGGNQTPLGGMLESTPKVAIAKTTPNKNGVDTTPIKQGDKFKGETNPTPMDNSTKFLGETNTKPMSLEERYLGETNTTKSDISEKFLGETTPNPANNTSNFLGETTPNPANNSSNFLGETTPNPANNSSNFLGETTPNKVDTSEKFLGETTQTPSDHSSNFLGETTPNKVDTSEKFLGETTQTPSDHSSNFLGETTQTPSDHSSNFLGETTPNPANNTSNFLGETTPTPANNTSNFLGETTPNPADNSSNFLGETTPTSVNYFSDIHATGFTSPFGGVDASKFVGVNPDNTVFNGSTSLYGELGTTNFFSDGKAAGFTPNLFHRAPSKFTGVDSTGTLFNGSTSFYGELGSTNFFSDGKAAGFTPNLFHRAPSKFTGVDSAGTLWDSTTSIFSNHTLPDVALSFGTGYREFQSKTKSGNTQQYTPDSANYESAYKSIGTTMEQRNSPSFLDLMYAKYNLREDAYNSGLTLFNHPLILRGIQRKGISKGEPQNWGIGGVTFDDGFIRGGVITSTVRAAVDVARIGAWMLSIKGLLWGVRQFGLQATQKFGKAWTPIGLLAAVGGQHIGLHAQRPGLIPLVDNTFQYQNNKVVSLLKGDFKDKLATIYNMDLGILRPITELTQRFSTQTQIGGPKSVYGIGVSGTRRWENTFNSAGKRNANIKANVREGFSLILGPELTPYTELFDYTLGTDLKKLTDPNLTNFGVAGKAADYKDKKSTRVENTFTSPSKTNANATAKLWVDGDPTAPEVNPWTPEDDAAGNNYDSYAKNQLTNTDEFKKYGVAGKAADTNFKGGGLNREDKKEVIQDYQTIAYGDIPDRSAGSGTATDFRSLLKDDVTQNKKRADNEDYGTNNINTRVHFGNPGLIKQDEDRTTWWNTTKDNNNTRFDKIQASGIGETVDDGNDLVHLWFANEDGSSKIQFRGTVSGITDTFSPTWDSYKYNGRADSAYQYKSFERSLSFNIQVYATSRIEMKPIYSKLGRLASMTMPDYVGSSGYNGSIIKFQLGNLFENELAFIESLSYTMSDETPWDVSLKGSENFIGELPMGIDVAIGLKILGKVQPEYGKPVYNGY
jgi:hypothetical protein